jgi:taurine dioxygenase
VVQTAPTQSPVQTRPPSAAVGTEFLNLDLRKEQSPEVVEAVRTAFFETGLVLVRGQDGISFDDQQRFASYLGKPTKRFVKDLIPGTDELPKTEMYIGNAHPEGYLQYGILLPHSDYCMLEKLLLGISLYGDIVPENPEHGATYWVNAQKAAETLPGDLRQKLEGKMVRHVFDNSTVEEAFKKHDITNSDSWVSYTRPALLQHPVTGEEILYVNELMTDRFEGLTSGDSDQLLNEVYAHLKNPELRYQHSWVKGDVLVWDNIKLQHGRTEVPHGVSRSLRRLMIDARIPA